MLFCTRHLPTALRLLATIFLLSFSCPDSLFAQDGCMQMGMNLSGLSYWGSDHAFKDAFKYSGTFRTEWAPGFSGTGEAPRVHLVPLDAEGYPFEIPYTVPGRGPVIVQAPVLLHSDGKFPRGIYSLFWEGVGTIDFWGAAIVPGSYVQGVQGGRALVEVLPTSPGMFLRIIRSQRGNHIRNVRLVRPGFESDYLEQPFNPEFLERVRPFYSIRYMGWMNANTNDVVAWFNRTTPRSQTQSRYEGASYEHIIQLSNLTQTHPWINVPYAADDDHVRRMAQLFYDSFSPELNVYLEYANEFWNFAPGFPDLWLL